MDAGSCNLNGRSEVSLSGKVATFGARMADAVAEQVLKQFAANFAAELQAQASVPTAASAPAAASATGATPATGPETSLNGLELLWAVVRGWLRTLGLHRRDSH